MLTICYNFVTFVKGVRIVCYDEFVVHSGDETVFTAVSFKVMVVSVVNHVLL